MERSDDSVSMIDMFPYPVFCVRDGIITDVNHFAQQRQIRADIPVSQILLNSFEYESFHGGCLSLSVITQGVEYIATVLRTKDADVFHLYDEHINERLCAMSLTAQQIRQPLSDVITASEELIANATGRTKDQSAYLKKSLYQLQRLVNNISAANSWSKGRLYGLEPRNTTSFLKELLTRAQELVSSADRVLVFTCPDVPIYCHVDPEILEKAVYNLISNAVKGSPKKSTIHVTVEVDMNKLRFSIQNTDNGLGKDVESLFFRYMRAPQVEDGRHGLGLGIPLVQFAAAAHGGTLLMDRPSQNTIRFTMTISAITGKYGMLRSSLMPIDTYGGWDHSLIELSDILPASAFENT